jgi:hypothetical protein
MAARPFSGCGKNEQHKKILHKKILHKKILHNKILHTKILNNRERKRERERERLVPTPRRTAKRQRARGPPVVMLSIHILNDTSPARYAGGPGFTPNSFFYLGSYDVV